MKKLKPKMLKDVKITKPVVTLPVEELIANGVYLTHTKDLIQIREINKEKKTLHIFNITEQCSQWTDFSRHIIVERVR